MSVRRRARAAVVARREERQKVISGLEEMGRYLTELSKNVAKKIAAEKAALKRDAESENDG